MNSSSLAPLPTGLPTLYGRRSDGGVQTWRIEVEDNRHRSIAGIHGGQLVTNEWTTCLGKNLGQANETTPAQQAEKEARAKFKKKQDEGYKLDVAQIDLKAFFAPMLAHVYEDYPELVKQAFDAGEEVYLQPKLDGMRCICTRKGMFSRNGKPILSAPHIHKFICDTVGIGDDWRFDGELYTHRLADDFNQIISLAKKTKPTPADLAESAKHLQYHIYDQPSFASIFADRYRQLRACVEVMESRPGCPIVLVETVIADGFDDILKQYSAWCTQGYEGAMIRLNRDYDEGKRSKHLLKYKTFQDDEFLVRDVLEGKGNRSGMAGFLSFQTAAGRPFTAAVKGNMAFFTRLLKDKRSVVGRMATVKYFSMTPDGSPRFPVVTAIRDYE